MRADQVYLSLPILPVSPDELALARLLTWWDRRRYGEPVQVRDADGRLRGLA